MADNPFTPDKRLAALQAALKIADFNSSEQEIEAENVVEDAQTVLDFLEGGDKP